MHIVESSRQEVQPDFLIQDEGTIVILYPHTPAAEEWAFQNLPQGGPRWGGNGYVVEHRFIDDIRFGIHNDGLVAL